MLDSDDRRIQQSMRAQVSISNIVYEKVRNGYRNRELGVSTTFRDRLPLSRVELGLIAGSPVYARSVEAQVGAIVSFEGREYRLSPLGLRRVRVLENGRQCGVVLPRGRIKVADPGLQRLLCVLCLTSMRVFCESRTGYLLDLNLPYSSYPL